MDLALKEKVVKAVLKTIDQGWYHKDIDLSAIYDHGYQWGWDYKEGKRVYENAHTCVWLSSSYEMMRTIYKASKFRKRRDFDNITLTYRGPDISKDDWHWIYNVNIKTAVAKKSVGSIIENMYALAWMHGRAQNPFKSEIEKTLEHIEEMQKIELKPETKKVVKDILKDVFGEECTLNGWLK